MSASLAFRRRRLLPLLILCSFIGFLQLYRKPADHRPTILWSQRPISQPPFKRWPFYTERSIFRATFKDTCPAGKLCVGFGTPLFGSWKSWIKYATTWTSGFKQCHVPNCSLVADPEQANAVIFHGRDLYNSSLILQYRQLDPSQRWIYFSWESPSNIASLGYNVFADDSWRHVFNWTATYQRTADIYTPYGATEPRHSRTGPPQPIVARKHLAFAVLSNCMTSVKRLQYLKELQKHMELHIFGSCGKPFPYKNFHEAAQQYHFILAMENSRCRDYMTEKFWRNGLEAGVVPVVFGPSMRDYSAAAPPASFVAGELFESPRHLAKHLKTLAASPLLMGGFFAWKRTHRIRKVDKAEDFFCKLCAKLHKETQPQSKDLFEEWSLRSCKREPWI